MEAAWHSAPDTSFPMGKYKRFRTKIPSIDSHETDLRSIQGCGTVLWCLHFGWPRSNDHRFESNDQILAVFSNLYSNNARNSQILTYSSIFWWKIFKRSAIKDSTQMKPMSHWCPISFLSTAKNGDWCAPSVYLWLYIK